MNAIIQRDFFFDALVEINKLTAFKEWFFYRGMLFGSLEKWWGRQGERPAPHEGLDVGYYKDINNRIHPLNRPFQVPVAAEGTIIEISDDDFLGKSVFVRHDIADKNAHILHSVYAHSSPSGNLKIGDTVLKGDVIAETADISNRGLTISGHLHLSMIWLSEAYPVELLKWQILPNSDQALLADPFEFLDCSCSIENYQPEERV